MYQIVAIGPKHPAELSLYLGIERDAVGIGAINIVLAAAFAGPAQLRFGVAARAVVIVLIFALAHFAPELTPRLAARTWDDRATASPLLERVRILLVPQLQASTA